VVFGSARALRIPLLDGLARQENSVVTPLRTLSLAIIVAVLAASDARAQLEELFSRHVRIFQPKGVFAQRLIKLRPGGGEDWREISSEKGGVRLAIPTNATADTAPSGSRLLQIILDNAPTQPRPTLRIDAFTPQPGDPTAVTNEYAEDYADGYSEEAFGGKFETADSGRVVLANKLTFAMVGGAYPSGAVRLYRMQWAYLSKDRQLFLTFDCSEHDWERYAELLGRVLLSFEAPKN
jgi:hypothetical protein